jgi:hypothetical protein
MAGPLSDGRCTLTGIRVVALLASPGASSRAAVISTRDTARTTLAGDLRIPIRNVCRDSGTFEIKITPSIQLALLSGRERP